MNLKVKIPCLAIWKRNNTLVSVRQVGLANKSMKLGGWKGLVVWIQNKCGTSIQPFSDFIYIKKDIKIPVDNKELAIKIMRKFFGGYYNFTVVGSVCDYSFRAEGKVFGEYYMNMRTGKWYLTILEKPIAEY